MNLLLKKYNPNWVNNFADIKLELDNGLPTIEYCIKHVGSTAVPNLDSKPTIDIDIIYNNVADFEKIKLSLEKLGYFHNGNQGIVDREVFKRNKQCKNEILDSISHHLYVCTINSKALDRHVLLRNFYDNMIGQG